MGIHILMVQVMLGCHQLHLLSHVSLLSQFYKPEYHKCVSAAATASFAGSTTQHAAEASSGVAWQEVSNESFYGSASVSQNCTHQCMQLQCNIVHSYHLSKAAVSFPVSCPCFHVDHAAEVMLLLLLK